MAFKLKGASPDVTKFYLTSINSAPVGSRWYEYVTTDTAATVAATGYIDSADGGDSEAAYEMLEVGDTVYVFTVGAIDDTQTVSDDKADGITDISQHVVLVKSATQLTLSDDMLAYTVTGESS